MLTRISSLDSPQFLNPWHLRPKLRLAIGQCLRQARRRFDESRLNYTSNELRLSAQLDNSHSFREVVAFAQVHNATLEIIKMLQVNCGCCSVVLCLGEGVGEGVC